MTVVWSNAQTIKNNCLQKWQVKCQFMNDFVIKTFASEVNQKLSDKKFYLLNMMQNEYLFSISNWLIESDFFHSYCLDFGSFC